MANLIVEIDLNGDKWRLNVRRLEDEMNTNTLDFNKKAVTDSLGNDGTHLGSQQKLSMKEFFYTSKKTYHTLTTDEGRKQWSDQCPLVQIGPT